jgi:hypothetical protein
MNMPNALNTYVHVTIIAAYCCSQGSIQLREDRPRRRQQLIDEGRMDPDGPMRLDQAVKRVGICTEMCPEYERVRRIVEEDLKLPEYVGRPPPLCHA